MLESKLIKSLRKLDSKTKERLKNFVISPYFNQHKKTIELLKYLLKYMNAKPEKLERAYVFGKIYPGEKYSEQSLFNLMSSLKKLYHRFLAQEHYEEKPFQQDVYLLEACFLNHQFDLLKNRSKNLDKQLNNYPFIDKDYYDTKFQSSTTMAYYNDVFGDRSKSSSFQDLNDNLDRYYFAQKLRHSCQLTSNMVLMNVQYDLSFLEQVLTYYKENKDRFVNDHSIRLYYTILMSLREEENAEYYLEMKNMLVNEVDLFSPQDKRSLYSHANNYCVRQINNGKAGYQKELFDLYKQGLLTGLIFENGFLNEWNYKNITVLGCTLKEFTWTEDFLYEYRQKLPVDRQENSYNYNMAHLHYSKQNYTGALDHLLHVRFSDVKYHLNYNNLLLATYYALGDTEALMSLIDTFRIYVMRSKKLTSDQKKQYTNFLRFAKNLVNIKQLPDSYGRKVKKEKYAQLYFKIDQTRTIVNRYWLKNTCRQEAGDAIEQLQAKKDAN